MQQSTSSTLRHLRALALALAALLAGTAGFAAAQSRRLASANARLDAMTRKAIYETCELTEALAVNLRKLQVVGEAGRAQALLGEVALETQGALSNLALLPVGQETVSATLKFINQAGDYASVLSSRLARGGGITEADTRALSSLAAGAAGFSAGMSDLLLRWERGEVAFDGPGAEEADLAPITDPAAAYPVLLYDGPFSDGRADGVFRGLEGLADAEEPVARAALARFMGVPEDQVTFTGRSDIDVPCYEYSLRAGDYALTAGVTVAGAKVLYVLCEGEVTEVDLSRDEAVDAARAFLVSRGYGEVVTSYASRYEGILTVNFAPVAGGVTLYPDLIKVQVSLRDGAVVGLEAAGYLMNHVPRSLPAPALTERDALDRLGDALTPRQARLCLIPDGDAEALCYEITAEDGDDTFLAYIDALTGAERALMQVVEGDGGALVV